ncbi:MAG: GGDEF domain-containing protein [Kosmotoga sp.]|nr:MAG: GGDEF domain-containing protein [Kosmotoga sp.]
MVNDSAKKQKGYIKALLQKSQRESSEKFENKLKHAHEAFLLSSKHGFIEGEKDALNNLIQLYIDTSEYEKASENCDTLMKMCEKSNDRIEYARALNKKGLSEWQLGNVDVALDCLIESLSIFRETNDSEIDSSLLSNIGIMYSELGNNIESMEYFEKAINQAQKNGNEMSLASGFNNMGILYARLNKNNESIKYFKKALEIKKKIGNKRKIITSLHNISDLYDENHEYDEAEKLLIEAEEIAKQIENPEAMAFSKREWGKHFMFKGDYDKAIEMLKQGLEKAEEKSLNSMAGDIALFISESYEKLGDYKNALEYHKYHDTLKEKIYKEDLKKNVAMIENRYAKKEKIKEAEFYRKKHFELMRINEKINKQNEMLERAEKRLKRANKLLKEKSVRDSLTGLFNHKYMNERLKDELKRSRRYNEPLSVALFDLDDFKRINDTYGHQIGDKVLRIISKTILNNIREVDMAFRYGGEEFLLLFPNTVLSSAVKVCERIKKELASANYNIDFKVTLSGGVVQWSGENINELVKNVDSLLYKAKNEGKDRFIN